MYLDLLSNTTTTTELFYICNPLEDTQCSDAPQSELSEFLAFLFILPANTTAQCIHQQQTIDIVCSKIHTQAIDIYMGSSAGLLDEDCIIGDGRQVPKQCAQHESYPQTMTFNIKRCLLCIKRKRARQ